MTRGQNSCKGDANTASHDSQRKEGRSTRQLRELRPGSPDCLSDWERSGLFPFAAVAIRAAGLYRNASASAGQQESADERIEIAVQHAVNVPHLELGAVIFDQAVRLQSVSANLTAEA